VFYPLPAFVLYFDRLWHKKIEETRTTTRSCQTRKRAFHFYSPGVVRRSHAAARHVAVLLYGPPPLLVVVLLLYIRNLIIKN